MTPRHAAALAIALVTPAALMSTGCEQNCDALESDYQQALAAEQTQLAEPASLGGDTPAQFGLALKTELVADIANIVLRPTIETALSLVSTVEVSGERVDVRSEGDILELVVDAHPACEHCFTIGGDLGGSIVADIPNWGEERADLGGSFSIVAPLLLERGEASDAALKFDLPAMVDVGQSTLSANLRDVDPDIAAMLDGPVSQLLLDTLARQLQPVTIAEFNAPSFGIPGFEVLPVQLVTDDASGTVFAGFATNIEALDVPGATGVTPITDLADTENVALAFQPEIIGHSLSLLMGDGQVPRTYDLTGAENPRGSAKVALDGFRVGRQALAPRDGDDASLPDASTADATTADAGAAPAGPTPDVPFALGFDVFNLSSTSTMCFGFGAEALGGVSVRQGALAVELVDVRFTDSFAHDDLVPLSSWANAAFVERSRTLVRQSLDQDTVSVTGADLSFADMGLETRPGAVVLRARSSATANAP